MISYFLNLFLKLFNLKIIRFLSYNNPNLTLVNYKKKKIIKIAFSKFSKILNENEYEGYKWYVKKNKLKSKIKKFKLFSFFGIEINQFKGKKVIYTNSFTKNLYYINRFIKHYKKIWKKNSRYAPAHGDLTFENIIFNNNNIYIIDWEFFKKKDEINNYDLVYFFLSTIILPNLNKTKINFNEKRKIKKIWNKIKVQINNKYLKKDPISFFLDKFKNDSHWNKLNFYFSRKFFLNKTNITFLDYLNCNIFLKSK